MKDFSGIKDYQVAVLGLLIALGAIISTYLLSSGIIQFQKLQAQAITVTGLRQPESNLGFCNLERQF